VTRQNFVVLVPAETREAAVLYAVLGGRLAVEVRLAATADLIAAAALVRERFTRYQDAPLTRADVDGTAIIAGWLRDRGGPGGVSARRDPASAHGVGRVSRSAGPGRASLRVARRRATGRPRGATARDRGAAPGVRRDGAPPGARRRAREHPSPPDDPSPAPRARPALRHPGASPVAREPRRRAPLRPHESPAEGRRGARLPRALGLV